MKRLLKFYIKRFLDNLFSGKLSNEYVDYYKGYEDLL
jgi:hypothetical protein